MTQVLPDSALSYLFVQQCTNHVAAHHFVCVKCGPDDHNPFMCKTHGRKFHMAQTNTSLPASENTIGATPAPRGAKAQNGFQEPAAGNTGPTHSPALPSGHSKVQNKIPADPPQARSKAIFDGDPAIVRDGRAEAFAVFEEARGA